MSKLDLPALVSPLTANAVNAWLLRCEDAYEAWCALNQDRTLPPGLRILLAGLKMEDETAANWWTENRDTLKSLETWIDFSARVRDRFVPASWRLDALAHFFAVTQGQQDFTTFVAALQAARNSLSSAGVGFTISDSTLKNHLLFFANPILSLRVRSLQSFRFEDLKSDELINLMTTTWASLCAEGVVHAPASAASSTPTLPPPARAPPPASDYSLPSLSYAERASLHAVDGSSHCRHTPLSPGWKSHTARDCPGDVSRGETRKAKVESQSSQTIDPVEPTRFAEEWFLNTTQNQIPLAPNTSPSAPSVAERTAAVQTRRDSMPRSFRQLQSLMTSAQKEGNWPALKKVKNLCAEAHSTPREDKTDLQRYLLTQWRSPIWDSPNHQAAVESPLASSLVKNNPRLDDSVEVWASYLKRHPTSWPRGVRRNGAGEPHLSDLKASRVVAQLRPDTHSSADSPARRAQFMALVVQIFSAKGTYLHLLAGKTPHSVVTYQPYIGPLEEMTLATVAHHLADCGVPVSLADHELFDWSTNYLAAAPTSSALEDTAATSSSRER